MPRPWLRLYLAASCAAIPPRTAVAGAFPQPEGQGQLIAGVGYTAGSRRFEPSGRVVAAPAVDKAEASGYLEYGLTPSLTLVAAPTLARETGVPAANTVTGSDDSAFGARLQLWGNGAGVLAVQVLVQPPLGAGGPAAQVATGGARSLAVDLRVLGGWSFPLFGLPAFADVEPGVRVRADPLPNEARLDLAVGLRPFARLQILLQAFDSLAPRAGPLIPSTSYAKGQASLVYDLSPRWSSQVGVIRTLAGRNALRETGPLFAVWHRF